MRAVAALETHENPVELLGTACPLALGTRNDLAGSYTQGILNIHRPFPPMLGTSGIYPSSA